MPQGLGNHADHLQTIRAAQAVCGKDELSYYQDTPYVMRDPGARVAAGVPDGPAWTVAVGTALDRKLDAACAYESQIGFQFGGPGPTRSALSALAARTGGERLIGTRAPPAGHGEATI